MDVTREELLIGRVVERAESPADWEELRALAHTDAALWTRLHEGMRDDATLRAAVAPLVSVAESVDVPAGTGAGRVPWGAASGWLAAAAVVLAWLLGVGERAVPSGPSGRTGDVAGDPPPAHLAGAPFAGLGELPRVLIEAQPSADGRGLRVVSMRRILEESFVEQVFKVEKDERGEERPFQVELARFTAPSDF